MKVKDPLFRLEKIRKYLAEDLIPTRRLACVSLDDWRYTETSTDDKINDAYPVDYDDSSWKPFRLWDTWGGYDRTAWFRGKAEIPENWDVDGNLVALHFSVGPRDGGESTAETLLYVDGSPVQGLDVWHEEAFLGGEFLHTGKPLCLALKSWSGVLNPPKFRTFKTAELLLIHPVMDKFCYQVDTLLGCAEQLEDGDLRRIRLTELLNRSFSCIDFLNMGSKGYYDSVCRAKQTLDAGVAELAAYTELKPQVTGVGHSHIDMAWLWRLNATREKASRTFSTVLNLMRQYPEYKFMHSSPQLYKFLQQDYPEIFAQVKEKIDAGQWEITGGMWVEPDTNIPTGEALVRQFLFGTRYIRETFGKESRLAWLPDVFGYSGAMPQIMRKSGMEYFMTTKISWNQYNHFPYDTFRWKGIDGTEILTHFITTPEDGSWFYTYNGHMTPDDAVGIWKNYKDKDKNDKLLIAYGWGDGGGGPTREMIEGALNMKNVPGIPNVKLDTAENYFAELAASVDQDSLNVWDGELYFEYHRGTYTSQGRMKRDNRTTEVLLHDLEALFSMGDMIGGGDFYPQKELNALWERVLLNQFHDTLPGSAIRQVYEDCRVDFEDIREKGAALRRQAEQRLFAGVRVEKDSVVVYNTTCWDRSEAVTVPYSDLVGAGTRFSDESGPLPCQHVDNGVLVQVRGIPSYGWKALSMIREDGPVQVLTVTEDLLDTPFHRIELNAKGEITRLFDKRLNMELSCGEPMNVLRAFEDKPQRFDAWDIDIYYREKPYPAMKLLDRKVIECGAVRGVIRLTWGFNQSIITQDVTVYQNLDRIDFKTRVNWKERQVLLKVFFPVDVHAQNASYEIQFGNIERPTHTNTEWDFAKFEVCGHRWADLSEAGYGVALLNDCKYGHDIHGNTLSLTLIKSAVRPDETADRCEHEFTYSLYPHAGTWRESQVQRAAVQLNMPLGVAEISACGSAENTECSLFRVNSGHVLLDTVKRCEDERAYIIRLYEYQNKKDEAVELIAALPVKRAAETDLMENELSGVDCHNGVLRFSVHGYEIKTLKLWF